VLLEKTKNPEKMPPTPHLPATHPKLWELGARSLNPNLKSIYPTPKTGAKARTPEDQSG